MFAKLVEYPTVAGKGAVPGMAAYLGEQLIAAGFSPGDIQIVPHGETAGMIVRYAGTVQSTKEPVLFLAHMDVVDAQKDQWTTEPWVVTEKDGAFHGRGVVDNKYGVLTIAHAFMRLKREGFVPDRDLVIAFTGDEETGMKTTKLLAERLKGAAFAVNSDAGGGYRAKDGSATYAYQAAEKTYATFELTARNPGGHSSSPRPDNAIYQLGDGLRKIAAYRFPVKWNEVSLASFAAWGPALEGDVGKAMVQFARNPNDGSAVAILEKEPWIDRDLRTTCVATMFKAGMVENALPTTATATVNCRIFPGETVAEVQSVLARLADDKAIEIKLANTLGESPISAITPDARAALDAVLAVREPKASVSPYMEAGGTDGLQFRRAGVPTIGIGPLFATDESNYNFHGNNERLPIAEFEEGLDHFYLFIKALAGPK